MKPSTPMRGPQDASTKPTTPLLTKIAPKTGVSGLQWCRRFHRRQSTRQQRRWRFHVSCRPTGELQQSAVEGTEGPDRGARGWRRYQAAVPVGGGGAWPGFEATRRAQLAARTARGRAAAHGHTKQPGPAAGPSDARNTSGATHPPGYAKGAGTEVPAPLSAHSATASSRLRPNDPQSWRRRRIHRNIPPTTAAPRPAPPIRPSKPVRARR